MRLTAFTDFGLRALMRLAGEPERLFTTEEIAAEYAISRHHLVKVVRDLAAAGFIETRRGTGGGFRLARPANEISLGEVVRALESRAALVECFRPDGGQCALSPDCRLKGHLARGIIDLTTTEVCDHLFGGVFPCNDDRFGAVIRTRIPYIGSVGALGYGRKTAAHGSVPAQLVGRQN